MLKRLSKNIMYSLVIDFGSNVVWVLAQTNKANTLSLTDLQKLFNKVSENYYQPYNESVVIYKKLYPLYNQQHDAFCITNNNASLYNIIKKLIQIINIK